MLTDRRAVQEPGIARIKALLLAARPGLVAKGREVSKAFLEPPSAPGQPVPDRSPAITGLVDQLKALRTTVEGVAVQGAGAVSARDLAAHALLETEQALGKLVDTYAAPNQETATGLLAESVKLLKAAKATGALAGKALGIAWPLL